MTLFVSILAALALIQSGCKGTPRREVAPPPPVHPAHP
jgi:hypothetical protein